MKERSKVPLCLSSTDTKPTPRPWSITINLDAAGHPRSIAVNGNDGSCIEHRTRRGHTPETFARIIANMTHYVHAVNEWEKALPYLAMHGWGGMRIE